MDGGLALEDLTGSVDLSELFDTNGSTIDLGGMMDFNDMQIDLPAMEGLNLEEVLGNIELSVSAENFGEIFDGLLAGYQEYATENPQADYSHLGENFLEYLRSDGAKEILKEHILGIIQENGDIIVSTDQFEQLFREISGLCAGKQLYRRLTTGNVSDGVFADGGGQTNFGELGF